MSDGLDPLREILTVMAARDWDLHVERAGSRAQSATGAGEPLWVAAVSRHDFALEAQARTPALAVPKLYDEIVRYCRLPSTLRPAAPGRRQ